MSDLPKSPAEQVSLILDRHKESRRWMKANYYNELRDVYRAIKMRTVPILKKDESGKETNEEDKTQTNVCMPGPNITWRKGVARLTASPYRLKYIGNADPRILESLSALAYLQYDRSNEAYHDRRVVSSAKAFGFGYSKLFWDRLDRVRTFRRALVKDGQVMYRDRATVRQWQGVGQSDIQQEVQEYGPQLNDNEVADFLGRSGYQTAVPDMTDEGMAQFIAQQGNVIQVPMNVSRYEGPVLKNVFIGDLDLAPGCLTLEDSDYIIESYSESELWLKKQMDNLRYKADDCDDPSRIDPKLLERDADGTVWVKAFDPDACQELLDKNPEPQAKVDDLREYFLAAVGTWGQNQYQFPKSLRALKRLDFMEQHVLEEDGRMWVTWISPQATDKPLGRMPYPWDLCGKSSYTELVPLEDMLGAYGDSTPRLMRFLHAMHNRTVAQNFDYISNVLRKFILKQTGVEISEDIVTRGNHRELEVSNINLIKEFAEAAIPPGAFEREGQLLRMMALLAPELNTVDTGTASNPMAGKLATTAMINARAADALTQFEIDARDLYTKQVGEKKLWMNQQAASEEWEIEQKFWGEDLRNRMKGIEQPLPVWALSDRYGKTAAIRLDPLEIQEDLQVEPESMSYLSVNDELRRAAAVELDQVALAAPDIVDRRKVVRFHISTVRDVGNPDDYLLPEPTTPPPPQFKGSINLPLDKIEQIPADIVNQILPMMGLQPSQELANRQMLDAVGRLNQAGKEADELTSPHTTSQAQAEQASQTNGKPNGKATAKPKEGA